MIKLFSTILSFSIFVANTGWSQTANMARIEKGGYVPLYGANSTKVFVEDFYLDIYPVTNKQFLEFLKNNPKWRRSQVLKLFADDNYLHTWLNDTTLGSDMLDNSPVTNVSWFAAKEYCDCQGKRLPTMNEWEYAAMASETKEDAQQDSAFNQRIIQGYETPQTDKKTIGSTFKNYWGVYDLHGLVWEWTSDFNAVLISGESRKDVDTDRNLFCAAGALNATNLMNYAAFMRYAFRGSLKAKYCVKNLGFRCAKSNK